MVVQPRCNEGAGTDKGGEPEEGRPHTEKLDQELRVVVSLRGVSFRIQVKIEHVAW